MKPIKIRIRRKTLVRTRFQRNHKYRSDWKLAGIIDYNNSFEIFKTINGGGVCENEAQFAKLLYKNYGSGIYSCIAWIKNRGDGRFFSFWKGELSIDGFKRLPKNITSEMKEKNETISMIKKKKNAVLTIKKLQEKINLDKISLNDKLDIQDEIDKLKDKNEINDKLDMRTEINESQDEIEINDEIIELENTKRGPSGYLKCATPIYRLHAYENYGKSDNITEVKEVDFW